MDLVSNTTDSEPTRNNNNNQTAGHGISRPITTTTTTIKPSPTRPFKFLSESEEMNAAHRRTMEDAHRIVESGFADDPTCSFFAVFDGHGGRGVVEYLYATLDKNIEIELRENHFGTIENTLTCAFLFSDIQSSKLPSTVGMGSTAAVLLMRTEGKDRVLYAANVGDTRAVLYDHVKSRTVQRLTVDHKATDMTECQRIERMGGIVTRRRVMGILSVSRSFGDFELKKYVVARPHVSRTVLGKNDGFVILACDGLWDVFSDQEAGEFVRDALSKDVPRTTIASLLVAQALKKGTTDNVTCLVIGL